LAKGKWADIVVVDKDLLNVGASNPALLMGGKVRMTIVGGKVIYSQ
jgi:predicted amidohydrolase YtcJ